jgi:hypothetical protein
MRVSYPKGMSHLSLRRRIGNEAPKPGVHFVEKLAAGFSI